MGRPDLATLETARLRLRPVERADVPAIVEGVGNWDVARWLAVVPYPYGPADAETFVAGTHARQARCWAIDDGSGLCGIVSLDPMLGYWLARRVWGRGYLTEAGDAVVDAWFADGRAGPLQASYMTANAASARVLDKLGFTDVGAREIRSVALDQSVPGRLVSLSREGWKARRRYRLATRRLRLQELGDGDLGPLRRIGGDPRVASMIPAARSPWPEVEARRWLETGRYRGRPGFHAAIRTRMGRLIGMVSMGVPPGGTVAGCAFFLDPAYWGRGLVTEAAGAFLADTMDRFGVPILTAEHVADNPAGGAVLRKLGFVRTGAAGRVSPARVEPAPVVIYRLDRANLKVTP